jgi:hypothetical protein
MNSRLSTDAFSGSPGQCCTFIATAKRIIEAGYANVMGDLELFSEVSHESGS